MQADIRAKGLKIAQFTARDITEQAEVYLAQHRDELITKAAADCLTFPEFARYRAEIDAVSVRKDPGNRTLPSNGDDNLRTNQQ